MIECDCERIRRWRRRRRQIRAVPPDPVGIHILTHGTRAVLLEGNVGCVEVGAGREVRIGDVEEADCQAAIAVGGVDVVGGEGG
jgi:hypothetical protein